MTTASTEAAPAGRRPLGSTGLTISTVTAGGGPLGSMPENFGYEVAEEDAITLVERIFESPIRAIDTANGYSHGQSEERIGKAIVRAGGVPDDFLVITKVDAKGGDYSGERVRRSVEESKQRLGLDFLPLVHLHDPEFHDFDALTAPGGAVDTLLALHDEGQIGHIGIAGGDVHEVSRYLELGVFEVCLVHNRWTLVDRSATDLLAQAKSLGVAVVNAAIYGGGILANPGGTNRSYGYRPATAATLAAIDAMTAVCARYDTDLPTASLLFSVRDPQIVSTIVGFSKLPRLEQITTALETDLPEEFWDELEELTPTRENWLDFQ
jgi:D-threo-aldose 1-dehydrogenase